MLLFVLIFLVCLVFLKWYVCVCEWPRLLTVFPQIRRLLEALSNVAAMLMKIMVLYSCVSYSFAAVGMAIFADAKSDILEPRWMNVQLYI